MPRRRYAFELLAEDRMGRRLTLLLTFVLTISGAALAQLSLSQAQLNGTVHDQQGGAVVRAKIDLRNVDTNQPYTATTNTSGYYLLANLPPGNYELSVEMAGFKQERRKIALSVGQTATLDIGLFVAGSNVDVAVSGEGTPIEPTRSELSQVI